MNNSYAQPCPLCTHFVRFDEIVSHLWELHQFGYKRDWACCRSRLSHLLRNESGSDFHFSACFAPRGQICSTFCLPVGSLPRCVQSQSSCHLLATDASRSSFNYVNLLDLALVSRLGQAELAKWLFYGFYGCSIYFYEMLYSPVANQKLLAGIMSR